MRFTNTGSAIRALGPGCITARRVSAMGTTAIENSADTRTNNSKPRGSAKPSRYCPPAIAIWHTSR